MEIKDNVTREIAFNIRIEKSQFGRTDGLSLLAFTPQTHLACLPEAGAQTDRSIPGATSTYNQTMDV